MPSLLSCNNIAIASMITIFWLLVLIDKIKKRKDSFHRISNPRNLVRMELLLKKIRNKFKNWKVITLLGVGCNCISVPFPANWSKLALKHAILLNLGSLQAIAMQENVYIFNYNRKGGKAFIDALLPRLNPKNMNGGPSTPFVLEVVEAALHSRIHRLEQRLWDLEPCVQALLEVLPYRLVGDILEELRISKQRLVELGSRAGATKQMLLDILEDTHEIRRVCIMGRNYTLQKNDEMECYVPLKKQIAEEEEEEIEMLLENYLQRCESCHGQAERLLDSAKEMEDSIAVNLRLIANPSLFPSIF
ncbi:magnesium transporter MRS2-11, chloroplastic-like [Olea europaea var. sylvestris]|uniref:magnesium transporter MRS2-11, chloroplastic-like n=1 Tax=Olea europaea var. sylvestris TaxID=158386 RepID=UPI000C1D2C2F|nr:magnesium transporter MRS2-11, chloroplastic-like [Olea europaea var. sylvestris]